MPKKSEPPAPQDFRALVRAALAAQGMSVYRLAKNAGVPERTINSWLAGDRESLGSERCEKIFAALGLEVHSTTRGM